VVQLVAVVKPFRVRAVLEALDGLEVHAGCVREVMGFGRQKGRLHRYLGSEYNDSFVPKVELTLFVSDADASEASRRIAQAARTGRMGDGKILLIPCDDADAAR
jgi:nitrogen regulatory protein PII